MKVSLFSTHGARCGLSKYTPYLAEALNEFCETEIIKVDPSYSALDFRRAGLLPTGDIIHVQHEWGVYCGHEQALFDSFRFNEKPLVITCHGGGHERFLEYYDKVILPNHIISNDGTVNIPHGVTIFSKPTRAKARRTLGIKRERAVTQWGFILPHKNYEATIEAIRDREDYTYLIAGSEERNPEYWKHLEQLMSKDFKPQLIKTGYITDKQIGTVLSATDLAVFPYLNGIDSGTLRYAVGNQVLSLASPIPFIVGIFSAYHVPYLYRPDLLKQAIDEMLNLKRWSNLYKQYITFAKCLAYECSWREIALQHMKVYKELMEA